MKIDRIIEQCKIIPVVVFNSKDEVIPVLSALNEGGIHIAEICFRTDCAIDAIKIAVHNFPTMLIGAGTVINTQQCIDALRCGAKFIVSPGLDDEIATLCLSRSISYFPGVATPSEIMRALKLGLDKLKFFPAEVFGGLKAIKAIGAAFPIVKFIPTGGINGDNLKEFLSCSQVFACGGSWMVKGTPEDIKNNCLKIQSMLKGE